METGSGRVPLLYRAVGDGAMELSALDMGMDAFDRAPSGPGRFGLVDRRVLWERGYSSQVDDSEGLSDHETWRFRVLVSGGIGNVPAGRIGMLTADGYLRLCALCYRAMGLGDGDPRGMYLRYADDPDGRMLSLDGGDPDAFARFLASGPGDGTWSILPGGPGDGLSLTPVRCGGWYIVLRGCSRRADLVRSALALHGAGVPTRVVDAERVLWALEGGDRLGVVPRLPVPEPMLHTLRDLGALDFLVCDGDLMESVGDRVEWLDP